jgi:hypothetical protein
MKIWSEYDRFDLEQDILRCSEIEEYLDEFLRVYLDKPEPLSEDEVHNYISGIKHVAKLIHGRLWDGFEQMVHNGHFVLLDKYKPTKGKK